MAHRPRGTPANLARRGEIATKTPELRPALSANTQPDHVLPLAHFGATSDVCHDISTDIFLRGVSGALYGIFRH
jgi:hypothetical protein